jgi:hypothetical protein
MTKFDFNKSIKKKDYDEMHDDCSTKYSIYILPCNHEISFKSEKPNKIIKSDIKQMENIGKYPRFDTTENYYNPKLDEQKDITAKFLKTYCVKLDWDYYNTQKGNMCDNTNIFNEFFKLCIYLNGEP